ncbi:cysteine-rich CWC family protein [Vibrio sp. CAU 1672]|uniref:cysteine-rich CWC family protein n=1 Tax=Vibrio sp. CAU 1672 TaxID=3032594 RepID=UPI0023DCCFDC|nr:cysteine-rich CWC family protein [Vibrio sp. CAU 1672]MDF2153500.1 cysteine-rich CWC family protein [Vibrio sp. CAU 1672]
MKSPCRAACKNNAGICSGCHRTMEEIAEWKDITDHQRDEIVKQISGHVSTHLCEECDKPMHCDISAGKSRCWCFELEPRDLSGSGNDKRCLCRKCLEQKPIA